jgi:hypothetical protein
MIRKAKEFPSTIRISPLNSTRPIMEPWICRIVVVLVLLPVTDLPFTRAQSPEPALQAAIETLSSDRMLADIRTLSGSSFNGRQTGTKDDLESAQWVAQKFLSAGLRLPHIQNGSLSLPFLTGKDGSSKGAMATLVPITTMPPSPALSIGKGNGLTDRQTGTDYFPIFDSPSADVQGRIVFVGYGIVDSNRGIDDYAGVDVNNSIVLFLRGKPEHYPRHFSHADKVRIARDRGALGYLTATGPMLQPYEVRRGVTGSPGAFYAQLPLDLAIPGAWISTALAQEILTESNGGMSGRLRLLQERLNQSPTPQAVLSHHVASFSWKTAKEEGPLVNVIGMLPGTGTETVIVGAHRDHFGRPGGILFPGADDNASGTAVILEVARALAKVDQLPTRTILFVSFSGEERDLLGSRLYASRPIAPLNSTKAMINIDHAGVGNGWLTVGITDLEKSVLQKAGQAAEVHDKVDLYGFFPGGDHVPFKEAGVPTVTVVSGGVHPHFHQPTDTADTIDPSILNNVARYVLAVTWQLAF